MIYISYIINNINSVRIIAKAIITKKGKFLTLKRNANDPARPNCWVFPGGNLEFGENINECIIREIKEETSLEVKEIKPLHINSEIDPKKNIFWIEIGYLCKYKSGEVKLSEEHSEYKWVTKDEFLSLESAIYLMDFVKRIKN